MGGRGRRPDDPGATQGRLAGAVLVWLVLLASLLWALLALRLTRDPVAGIDAPGGPFALAQFAVAALGLLNAWVAATRANWHLRTGQAGSEAGAALGVVAALFAIWLLLVLPGW